MVAAWATTIGIWFRYLNKAITGIVHVAGDVPQRVGRARAAAEIVVSVSDDRRRPRPVRRERRLDQPVQVVIGVDRAAAEMVGRLGEIARLVVDVVGKGALSIKDLRPLYRPFTGAAPNPSGGSVT